MNHRQLNRRLSDAERLRMFLDMKPEGERKFMPLSELRPQLAAVFLWSRAEQDRALLALQRAYGIDLLAAQSPATLAAADREAGFWSENLGYGGNDRRVFYAYVSVRDDATLRGES